MSRTPPKPPRDTIPTEERTAYDEVEARTQAMNSSNVDLSSGALYFDALLNSPEMAVGITQMGMLVRTRGERTDSYTHAQREMADMVLSHDFGYNGVLDIHIPDALAVGVRLEAIDAILHSHEEDLNDEETFLVTYIRQAISGQVTDESYAQLTELMGTRGAVDYTAFVLFLNLTIRMWQALGVPGASDEQVDAMIEDFRSGNRELPDPSTRFR